MKYAQRLRTLLVVGGFLLLSLSACAVSPSEASEAHAPDPVDVKIGVDCEPSIPPFLGSRTLSFPQADGSRRIANVKIPSSYVSREPAAVIVAFHGYGGSASSLVRNMQLDELADGSGVILVVPQGRVSEFERSSWGISADQREQDAEFIDEVLRQVSQEVCVDQHRVFAMGFSYGSIFAQRYACRQGSPIVAVAGVAGIMKAEPCPNGPVPFIYFHGTGDTITPFDGGQTLIGRVDGVEESLGTWAAMNGCGEAIEPTYFDRQTERRRWVDCPPSGEIRAYFTVDGGHRWPGGPIETWKPAHGNVETTLNATAHSWRFFERAAQAHERAN